MTVTIIFNQVKGGVKTRTMENTNTLVSVAKSKVFVTLVAVAIMATLVAAAVLFASSSGTITISEALNQTQATFSLSGFAGESLQRNFTITNDANVALPITVAWTQDANANNVSYTTNMPFNQTLQPGSNIVTAQWIISTGSPTGTFNGSTSFTRN